MATIAEAVAAGVEHLQAGRMRQAEQVFRQVLQAQPGQVDALHLLGVVAYRAGRHDLAAEYIGRAVQRAPDFAEALNNLGVVYAELGRHDDAEACYRRAITLKPDYADPYSNLGNFQKSRGRLDEAVAAYRRALELKPDFPEAHNNLGGVLKALGRYEEAVACYEAALRFRPDYADAVNNLGNVLRSMGRLDDAIAAYRRAAELRPDYADVYVNLGVVLAEKGDTAEAVACCQKAIGLKPDSAAAHNGLGVALGSSGRPEQALACYREAVRLQPDYVEAHCNMGNIFRTQGRLTEAAQCYREALRLKPDHPPAHNQLGNVHRAEGRLDAAIAAYQEAIRLHPAYADAHINLGIAHGDRGEMDQVIRHFEEAVHIQPTGGNRILLATVLPPIYQSAGDLQAWRARVVEQVRRLHEDQVRVLLTHENNQTLFFLAYQGLNDRDVMRDFARLHVLPSAAAAPPPAPPRGDKIRIGFVSRHFRNHTIGRLAEGLLAKLSRQDFEVTVFSVAPVEDDLSRSIRERVDRFVLVPANLAVARRLVGSAGLDVVYYTDVGMEPLTYALAHSRLAPVQCVTWGHPVTTGIPAVDYFISSEDLEVPEADGHYTEKLVRLKRLAVHYYRPEPPATPKSRADFGLPDDAHLYGCPQSYFKFHPDFDPIVGSILREDPQGLLLLIGGHKPHFDEALQRRFRATIPDAADRIRVVPRQDRDGFLSLNMVTDVLLDPVHFGGGNTSYEGLSFGVPIVTLPSQFLRGRITYAQYRQMGMMDCVVQSPEEYVRLALRLGTDAEYRRAMRDQIVAAVPALYEDMAGVRELEVFLKQAVERASNR